MKNKSAYVTQGALTVALYVVLTIISNFFGLASGIVQVRLSEALTILPVFIPAAVPGLVVGCIISNVITGCAAYDVIFGALATLIGAHGTQMLWKLCSGRLDGRLSRLLAVIPPIASNTLIVPWILSKVYDFEGSILYFTATVFLGELISAGIGGQLLAKTLEPYREKLMKSQGPAD